MVQGSKINVLLIDDQDIVLNILSKGLPVDRTINVVGTAKSGAEGLKVLPELRPDVIILDLEMPVMNGLEFLQQMMPKHPTPTIVLSSLTQGNKAVTQRVLEAGAVDFLSKPSSGMNEFKKILLELWTKIKVAATLDVSEWKDEHKTAQRSGDIPYEVTASQKILGMGDYAVVNTEAESLKIFALGSCVGLSLFSPNSDVVGMVHIALPNSASDIDKAKKYPGYYADTAIPAVIASMREKGFVGTEKSLIAKLVGGAKTRADRNSHFEIGLKNILATKKKLMQIGITVAGEELGGTISRTIMAKPGKNEVTITNPDRGSWTI
jgi:chemotaxis receptor (MCP) glutamine deamidase CheD/DNA-binding NarL/FixJ family response regulator